MATPQQLDERFREAAGALTAPTVRTFGPTGRDPLSPLSSTTGLTGALALELFEAQLASRHLDLAARWLLSFGEGQPTVSSAGYEGNAAVAGALRATDPALVHEPSAAFYCARSVRAGHEPAEAIRDVLRAIVAAAADPGAGGRRKVFGHPQLALIPTASRSGGHVPRAVGLSVALQRRAQPLRHGAAVPGPRLGGRAAAGTPASWPDDAVVVCSFDELAAQRSPVQAALTAAGWWDHHGQRAPALLVCEDGSATPGQGWLAELLRSRPGIRYAYADGADLAEAYDAASEAIGWVRRERRPALLHLGMARLLDDVDTSGGDTDAADAGGADPLVRTAMLLVNAGLIGPDEVLGRYDEVGWQVRRIAEEVIAEPKLASAAEVMAPLAPRRPVRVARAVADAADRATGPAQTARSDAFGGRLPEKAGALTLAQTIQAGLVDALVAHPDLVLVGGADGLIERFADRLIDAPADVDALLGLAAGLGAAGAVPVLRLPLERLHRAGDQLRGEVAPLAFLSQGAYRNPMVVRAPGLAPSAMDMSTVLLRDIPGLVVGVPSCAFEAAPMLRTCVAAAQVDGNVCVLVEATELYHVRDLDADDDNGWLSPYSPPQEWAREHVTIGRARVYGTGEHLTVITYGDGVRLSLRVAGRLAERGVGVRVVDLRWLSPLPKADIVREAGHTGRVLVVDGGRRSAGVAEGVLAALVDAGYVGAARRVAAADSFLPAGEARHLLLVAEEAIEEGARSLLGT